MPKRRIIYVDLVYLGLLLGIGLHFLIWTKRFSAFFECPAYRLQWGAEFLVQALLTPTLILIFCLCWWILDCFQYTRLPTILKAVVYLAAVPAMFMLAMLIPLSLVIFEDKHRLLAKFASPSGTYAVERIQGPSSCRYRVYRNQSIFQRYIGEFSAGPCDGTLSMKWNFNESAVEWRNQRGSAKNPGKFDAGVFRIPEDR